MTGPMFTNAQIDRLGERLRASEPSEPDLRLLDDYRRSFTEPYGYVVSAIRDRLKLQPTGRPAKATTSIRDKLRRESIRLSQMQDVAGCRVVVDDVAVQNSCVQDLLALFAQAKMTDRREHPSHGYRAVHVLVSHAGKAIEIQVRTDLQHAWAELSEKAADIVDPTMKYGGGPELLQAILLRASAMVAVREEAEVSLANLMATARSIVDVPPEIARSIEESKQEMDEMKLKAQELLKQLLDEIGKIPVILRSTGP